MSTQRDEILRAYRHLLRHALRACQYSKPSRFVVRDRLRNAFRSSPIEEFQPARIARTLEFLHNAASCTGIEHRLQKNLMHVWWERAQWRVSNQ